MASLFLISERKTSAALKNLQSIIETLQHQNDKQQERLNTEICRSAKLYEENGSLHNQLDAANTKAATCELKRCDYITCPKRKPPLSDQWRMDLEEKEVTNEQSDLD